MLLTGVFSVGGAAIQGEVDKQANPHREKSIVFDPNRTLSTYEGFYDLCNNYNADVQDAADAKAEYESREKSYDKESDPFGQERQSITALRENARGLRNQARDKAAQYNSDSSKNSRAPFKAADLPYTLPANGKETVECGSQKEGTR
jgi:hypothetical protein